MSTDLQRSSKDPSEHYPIESSCRSTEYVSEIVLLFNETVAIYNLTRQMINARLIDHTEYVVKQDLRGTKGFIFDQHI